MTFDTAVLWHVYPLGFVGAPREQTDAVEHRLRRITEWLPYARDLGASVLQLGPVFESETHGYDTRDHFSIDPRLGADADFDALIETASDLGLRVVLDGVFNHVGRRFPRFVEAEADPMGPAAHWFRRTGSSWADFEGHSALVALNHDEPEVQDHVRRVLQHWLDRGAAGWRLDAAYAVPPSFWRATVSPVRELHPDAWFVGEVLHGDYARYVADSGLDSVTQYELWKAIWSSIASRNFFELDWTLRRNDELLGSFTPLTFLGNHDVTRIASQLPDPRHLAIALVILLTVGGVPSIYYGDEQAFQGVKEDRAGGDDAVRPAFPDSPADLAPFGADTYRVHQRLIGLRRRLPWLVHARTTVERLQNEALVYRSESREDPSQAIRVALNLSDVPQGVEGTLLESSGPHAGQVPAHGWTICSV